MVEHLLVCKHQHRKYKQLNWRLGLPAPRPVLSQPLALLLSGLSHSFPLLRIGSLTHSLPNEAFVRECSAWCYMGEAHLVHICQLEG